MLELFILFTSDSNTDDRPLRRTLHRPVLWASFRRVDVTSLIVSQSHLKIN